MLIPRAAASQGTVFMLTTAHVQDPLGKDSWRRWQQHFGKSVNS
jgi:hypothetical protein